MKFKIKVTKTYVQTHIVEADDIDHANEIGSEIEMLMESNDQNLVDSEWNAEQIDDSSVVTYEPEQEYLK